MKLDYRLYTYVDCYFELSSSNTRISHPKRELSPGKTKTNDEHEKGDNLTT